MILAPDKFRDEEYDIPRKFWESRGAGAITASTTTKSRGVLGTRVRTDFLLDEMSAEMFDGIFFVGGAGSLDFLENEEAKELALDFVNSGKASGAICAAPRLFLHWGILKNKKFTAWNGDEKISELAKSAGAIFTDENATTDGKIVTANGPESAAECAEKFWEILK